MFGLIAIVVSLATAAYSIAMAKRMKMPDQERGGLAVNRFGIDKSIPVIYGTRQVPPVIVYQGVKDVSGDPDNEVYYAILVWTVGPITSLSDFTFDDLPYSTFGVSATPGDQRLEHCYGSDDQTMPAWFRNEAPDDMSGMDFRGLAVTYLKLRMDDEYKRYPQGRPEFKATITARSSNPVDVIYDYLFNSDYGCGWDVDWDAEHNELMRSYCNNVYDGQRLMTCNMVIDTEKKLQENVEDILQTCRGYLIEGQFGLKLEIDRAKDPVMHVSEDMLTGGMSSASVNINQRYNSVTIRFPNKDLKWKTDEVTFPEKNSALHLQWLEEDNGVDLTKEETVSGIDTFEHAMQYAEVLARASRDSTTLNLSVQSFVGWQVEEMDVVTVASQSRGWIAKPFSVREISYKEKETKLKLVEYQDSHYLWHQKPPKPDYPDTELPNPNKVAPPSDLSFLVSDLPGVSGVLAWNSAGGYTDGYDVIVVADGEEIWRQRTRTKYVAIPVFLSGRYELAVRTVGAIAVSGWSVLSIDIVAPDAPFEIQVDAGNTYIILRPKSTTLAFGTEYEFWFNGELRGTGVAWQIEGLQPETLYSFQVRAVNAVGQSEFVQVSAATTNDASVLLDILAGNLTREILDDNLNAYFDSLDESLSALHENQAASEVALTDMIGDVERSVVELKDVTEVNRIAATESIEAVKADLQRKDMQLQSLTRSSESAAKSVFDSAVRMQTFMQEHERRLLEGETLTDAVVYRDRETGLIINRAYQYTDTRYSEASLRIDGVAAQILLATQDINRVETETGDRLVSAEAAIQLNASAITQKASYSDVNEAISGAMAAITPAYSWQFNTTAEGWPDVTWNVGGTITGTVFSRSDLSFDADENTAIRLRVNAASGGTLSWNGGNQAVAMPAPGVPGEFETVILALSPEDGWTGPINSIRLVMDAEIASIEIGKPSASELQLRDLSYRVTQAEQELDAENARWSVYITQDFWNKNALQQSDVRTQIDAWNSTYGVTATLQTLSDNGTVDKANSAQSWIDGADAHITDLVVAYNGKSGGTDDQLAEQAEQLQAAQQKIDALDAEIDQTVVSITDVRNAAGDRERGYQSMLESFNDFLRTGEIETEKVSLSYAQQKINAHSTELASQAQSLLQLFASRDAQQASLVRLDKATADNEQAIAESNQTLTAQIEDESQARISAVSQVLSDLNQSMATLQSNLESQLDDESQARINAVSQVLSDLNQSLATLQSNLESQLDDESQARINAVSQVLSDLNQSMATLQSNLESQLDDESQARINAVSQVLSDLNQSMATLQSNLESKLDDETQARVQAISKVVSDADQARADSEQMLVSQISNVENQLPSDAGRDALLAAFDSHRQEEKISDQDISLSYANQRLTTLTTKLASQAQSLLDLFAARNAQQAQLTRLDKVVADNEQAIAESSETLSSQIDDESQARINAISQVMSDKAQSLATLQNTLESQLDDESQARINAISQVMSDTAQSLATLQNTLESQLDDESQARINSISQVMSDTAQSLATLQNTLESQLDDESQARINAISQVVSDSAQSLATATQQLTAQIGEQAAKVAYHAEAFVDKDGKATAKGGLTTDVNGRVSGMVNTNDGEQSALDLIADYLRVGVMQGDNFVPLLQLDAELRELILRGRMILGDGVELKNAASIQAQVGAGSYTLTLRNGAFPDDATATNDFVSTYGRAPEKDAHLTYRNAAGTASSMKRWTGAAWSTPTMIVHGDQITTGTVTGDRFVAGTEIQTPVLKGGTGEFSGAVRAQDGSFIDKVEIGSAGGYRVFMRSVTNAGYNVIEVVNSSGNVVFAVQGNGNLYSVGGGYLDNLTIGSNVDVMGRVRANQIIGDVVSAESVTINKSEHKSASWKSVGTISGINNTGHLASVVLNPISIYTQYGLSPNRDEQMRGYGTYYCRVLYNGSEVARTSSRLWSETGGGSSIRYASFMSPTYCRKIEADEEFTLTLQIYCEMQNFGNGDGTATMRAECDTVAQVFRSGSAFYN
ncbi:hypothetical protein [Vibrio sp. ABG19]|uniref:phage tail tip protein J-related protein n=1 Tax=Vibrio sp. ABG19 TaxID=2817385 RepID=UPI00249E4888|nr:hypothetical protein [Vibrio sp. ABG19]WGY45027.1 hypothetical protein J0X00_04800 [Vibrio sp. ABG19]